MIKGNHSYQQYMYIFGLLPNLEDISEQLPWYRVNILVTL